MSKGTYVQGQWTYYKIIKLALHLTLGSLHYYTVLKTFLTNALL